MSRNAFDSCAREIEEREDYRAMVRMELEADKAERKQHTPGPWSVGATYGNDSARIETEKGIILGAMKIQHLVSVEKGRANYEWSDELYANAVLAAAAPELLAFAERSADVLEYYNENRGVTRDSALCELFELARAAIAKASGAA